MMPVVFDQTVIEIDAGRFGLRATGQVMRFAGYLAIYAEAQDDASPDDESAGSLPDIHPGRHLDGSARHATVGPDLPELQLAHGHPARTLRRASGDHEAEPALRQNQQISPSSAKHTDFEEVPQCSLPP
jgi:hypothetical protein